MNTVLVTGASGFIGKNLILKLLSFGDVFVVGVDNFLMTNPIDINKLTESKNFKFLNVDVTDVKALQAVFDNYSFKRVYHLAANSDISISFIDPNVDFVNTFLSTRVLLECIRNSRVPELIFASSSAIFGDVSEQEVGEDYGPCIPISHYGACKLASESFISSYAFNYGINSLVLRFPNVIGNFMTHGVVFDLVKKAISLDRNLLVLGDGNQEKSYLHVEDLLTAFDYTWSKKSSHFDIFNISNVDTIKVSIIAEEVRKSCCPDRDIEYRGGRHAWKGDVPKFVFRSDKLRNTGWIPKYTSLEAVRSAIAHLKQFPALLS